jgi:hypothetical protein
MNDERDGITESIRALASDARWRQGQGAHPGVERLTTYHAGELTPAEEDQVQEHLAVCRHCTQLLLDLPAFLAAPAGAPESLDLEADASWQAIRTQLPGTPASSGDTVRRQDRELAASRTGRRSPHHLGRLAIAALIALVLAPAWIIAWRLLPPPAPAETLDLSASELQRGTAAQSPPPAAIHAAAAATILVLRLAQDQPDLRFRLELRARGAGTPGAAAGSPVILPVTGVVDSHTLLLVLARHQLARGAYQLRVLDAEHPSAKPLGDYTLEVVD